MFGQNGGCRLRPIKAQGKGQHPPFRQPAVERAGRHARRHGEHPQAVIERLVSRRHIAQHHVRMPRQQLGHGMDDDVGPVVEGAQGARRGKGVVDNQQDAGFPGQRRQAQNVGHPQGGVADHLDEDHPGLGADRGAHGGHIAGVDHGRRDAQTRQVFGHHAQGAAIKLVAADHVIARLGQAQQYGRHGGHTGGDHDAHVRCPFHRVDGACDDIGIGVSLAAVGIAVQRAFVLRIEHIGGVGCVDDRGRQRCGNRARRTFGQRHRAHDRSAIVLHGLISVIVSRKRRMLS